MNWLKGKSFEYLLSTFDKTYTCDVVELVQGLPPVVAHLDPDGDLILPLQVREDEGPDDAVPDHQCTQSHMREQVRAEELDARLDLGKSTAIPFVLVVNGQAFSKCVKIRNTHHMHMLIPCILYHRC